MRITCLSEADILLCDHLLDGVCGQRCLEVVVPPAEPFIDLCQYVAGSEEASVGDAHIFMHIEQRT